MMVESFADLFAESIEAVDIKYGALKKAEVVDINRDFVIVAAPGVKSEACIPIGEFRNQNNEIEVRLVILLM